MNLKRFAVVLLFGITAGVASAASFGDTAMLGPTDEETATNVVFGSKNPTNNIPGGNAIDGTVSSNGNLPNVTAAAVPEPSTIALLSFAGIVWGLSKIRRR
jgi:PEP-CTERM motif